MSNFGSVQARRKSKPKLVSSSHHRLMPVPRASHACERWRVASRFPERLAPESDQARPDRRARRLKERSAHQLADRLLEVPGGSRGADFAEG